MMDFVFLCSHHVLSLLSMMFLRFPMGSFIMFPKGVPNSSSLYLISFAQSSPLLIYIGEAKGRPSILTLKLPFWGASQVSVSFW
jgi:hypothetical protein